MVLVLLHIVARAFIAIITLIMAALISTPILDAALEDVMDMDVMDPVAPGLETKKKSKFSYFHPLLDFRAAASHYRHLEHYHRSLAAAYHHSADDALRCHPC